MPGCGAQRRRQGSRNGPGRAIHFKAVHLRGARLSRERFRHVCRGVHGADGGDFRAARPDPAGGGEAVTQNIIGLVLAVAVAVYLVAALLFPERF
ncbi:K(+)-transporting ATPase subunit F [Nocardia sp. alder85J]|uniref:K(+)-transporting ATPase subunit F n=1 Tax=Nocardia sp. alder85J TaxID=2862949 RepID=UPI001CD2BF04|nr:K(+)-transporting ATPase subunit F [Nocardia sp. alder85J]MCX4094047.1 K(+)-transporting ATPase subunit F [Nocardia sp. alder85J]